MRGNEYKWPSRVEYGFEILMAVTVK